MRTGRVAARLGIDISSSSNLRFLNCSFEEAKRKRQPKRSSGRKSLSRKRGGKWTKSSCQSFVKASDSIVRWSISVSPNAGVGYNSLLLPQQTQILGQNKRINPSVNKAHNNNSTDLKGKRTWYSDRLQFRQNRFGNFRFLRTIFPCTRSVDNEKDDRSVTC